MTIQCVDCGISETLTAKEEARFSELLKTVHGFQVPKRCGGCRKRRRDEKAAAPFRSNHVPIATPTVPIRPPVAVLNPDPPEPKEERPDVLFVLATKDFDDLVHGQPVIWRGVKVVLADIGFDAMRDAIEDAELEKAKKVVKANGH